MDKKIPLDDLSKPEQLATLTGALSEMADELDVLYSASAPNGSISARQGRLCLYNNSGTYTLWMNTDGATAWTELTNLSGLLTTRGDILYYGASGLARLPIGTINYALRSGGAGADPSWAVLGGTPAIVLGTAVAAGDDTTYLRTDDTILAFDATVPVTQAFSDSAATGSATVAARRDHKHGMPATPGMWEFVETLTLTGSSHTSATLPTDSDVFALIFVNVFRAGGSDIEMHFNDGSGSYTDVRGTGQTGIQLTAQSGIHGMVMFGRLDDHFTTGFLQCTGVFGAGTPQGHWTATDAITTVTVKLTVSSPPNTLSGTVHIFKLAV